MTKGFAYSSTPLTDIRSMQEMATIALDAMSGDYGVRVTVPAALNLLQQESLLHLILVGDETVLSSLLSAERYGDRLRIHHASEVVAMDETPRQALRSKKDSSMRVAINLVGSGKADACVSAGNTGALMATARFVLKTLAGIDRPAIIGAIPAIGGHTHMLDLGANAECTPEQLFQFAVMGAVIAKDIHDLENPRVGLLNIGEEEIKGHDTVRKAGELLAASDLNYIGFVEGNDIFSGRVDVVVTDGFTGNIALKTIEGSVQMVAQYLRDEFSRNIFTRSLSFLTLPVFRSIRPKLDPRRYNGASMVGLRGIVIKSHGGADELAFENAIRTAILEVEKSVPSQISELLETQLAERQAV